ncbi:hypothetical protein [Gracilibacillus suaedae]|uniref:hypothetical protein n=1 Tax=Gracilibacillus suaedae TaxID=2820273 RepID=UPI001ABEDA10|nr:hypothetical protein [Gracilibacillus suaedae]
MILTLNKNEKVVEKDIEVYSNVKEHINAFLDEKYIFSHLVIDGHEVYTDYEEFIDKHIENIEHIEIVAKTKTEFINETLLTAESYLNSALPELKVVVDDFYQKPSSESWDQFIHFTEGLKWISDMMQSIDPLRERPSNWEKYVSIYHELENIVRALAETLGSQDEILLADIINYEVIPTYERLKELVTDTIDSEGCRQNVN